MTEDTDRAVASNADMIDQLMSRLSELEASLATQQEEAAMQQEPEDMVPEDAPTDYLQFAYQFYPTSGDRTGVIREADDDGTEIVVAVIRGIMIKSSDTDWNSTFPTDGEVTPANASITRYYVTVDLTKAPGTSGLLTWGSTINALPDGDDDEEVHPICEVKVSTTLGAAGSIDWIIQHQFGPITIPANA